MWLPLGVTLGWRGDGDANAFVVGGEVSLVWFRSGDTMFHGPADPSAMYGLLLDAVWVSNPSHFRATVGAEVMAAFGSVYAAGFEAGLTLHSRGDVVGFRARGFFTLFLPSIYVGLDYHGGFAGEAGVLFKIPMRL